MTRIAATLAAIHLLPVPPQTARAPLLTHDDGVLGSLRAIDEQLSHLPLLEVAAEAKRRLRDAHAWAHDLKHRELPAPVVTLCGTDTHPGNYLVDAGGRAIFVDCEKALYGNPAADLAHASNAPSTMWDAEIGTVLDDAATEAFFRGYFAAVGAELENRIRPWLPIMRKLIALRTISWGVRWQVLSGRGDRGLAEWSAARLPPVVRAHMQRVTAAWLEPGSLQKNL